MFGAVGNDRLTEAHPEALELLELRCRKIRMTLRQELHGVLQPLSLFVFDCLEYSALPNRKKQLIASDFEGRLWTVDLLLASLSRQHNLRGESSTPQLFALNQPEKYNASAPPCKARERPFRRLFRQ
jgi:hypothetical protein